MAFTGAVLVALSCGQGDELLAPLTGAVKIEVFTDGSAADPDGYTVSIDHQDGVGVAVSDTIVREGLEPGSHTVALTGIAENCTAAGDNPLTTRVTADDTTSVGFRLSCASDPMLGVLLATVSTSGSPLDADGYNLAIDPLPASPTGLNDTVVVADLSAGEHPVRLQGVADHCSVAGENPRTISVPPGDTARTNFEVTCRPPLAGRIAFAGFRPDESLNTDLFMVRADGTGLVNLTASIPDIDVSQPSFSFDGRHLAASLLGDPLEIVLIGTEIDPATGSPPIRPVAEGYCPALSSDGSRLAYQVIGEAIYVQDVDGGTPERILLEPANGSLGCPAWSPDDSRLAVTAEFFPDSVRIYLVPVDGGEPQVLNLGPDDEFIDAVSWSPRGDRLAFTMPWPENVEERDVFVMDLAGRIANLTQHRVFSAFEPNWSPDGTRLVFGGEEGLFLVNDDGTGLTRLTHDASRVDREPTWGPE
jgi:hypothetical protein